MKKIFLCSAVMFIALLAWTALHANECNNFNCSLGGSSCGNLNNFGCDMSVCGSQKKSLWNFGGWVEVGVYGNSHGNGNHYNPNGNKSNLLTWDPMSANTFLMGPARQTGVQMNQAWLFLEKELNTDKGFDIGGRVDVVYGTDAYYGGGSRGLEVDRDGDQWGEGDYMLAIPQLYAELGYRNLSVKLGKFFTPVGYEGVTWDSRFFYSASYAFQPPPTSQTGALATWNLSDSFSVFAGITCGFDETGVIPSFFHDIDGGAALFGFDYSINNCWSIGYGGMWGKRKNIHEDVFQEFGFPNVVGADRDFYYHSLILKYTPNKCWDYTFEWFLENSRFKGNAVRVGFYNYGIHQQLIRRINNCWAIGFRGEWASMSEFDANLYELTLGVNWTPCKNLIVRPEIRYDFSDERIFDDWNKKDQFGFGASAIMKF